MRTTAPAVITVWGDFACWTKPECKVERLSYPVPTPSGIWGLLASIYSKPPEFYWQVKQIEVLNPIRFTTFKRNEVKKKLSYNKSNPAKSIISIEAERTQRQSVVLKNVRYRFLYELSVYSNTLGVSGKCDCVEAHAPPDGVALPYGEGTFQLYPVEYKHGVVRKGEEEYHLQLCAQALCLEEQFGCSIPAGAIFYISAHRRDEVTLTAALRQKTVEAAEKIQALLAQDALPPAKYSAKCKKCSLLSLCQPKWKRTATGYCQSLWDLTMGEEMP